MTPSTRRATLNAREQLAEGCMVWSDWTAERERDFDATWVRAMEKPRPVTVSASYRGLRTV